MQISPSVQAQLDEIGNGLCLAVQLEDASQASAQFERLERLVLESLPREDTALLQAATIGILRRAHRLATANRHAAAAEMSTLGATDPYQAEARRSASWRLDG